jgi:hypothetical protein
MKRSALFRLALISVAAMAIQRTNAGSAVATGPHGAHVIVSNPSYSEEVVKQKALALWHSRWRGQARILASTGVVGECGVAVSRKGRA